MLTAIISNHQWLVILQNLILGWITIIYSTTTILRCIFPAFYYGPPRSHLLDFFSDETHISRELIMSGNMQCGRFCKEMQCVVALCTIVMTVCVCTYDVCMGVCMMLCTLCDAMLTVIDWLKPVNVNFIIITNCYYYMTSPDWLASFSVISRIVCCARTTKKPKPYVNLYLTTLSRVLRHESEGGF